MTITSEWCVDIRLSEDEFMLIKFSILKTTMGVKRNLSCKYSWVQYYCNYSRAFVNEVLETFGTYLQIAGASWNPSQRPGSLLKVNVSLHSLTFSYLGLKLVEYTIGEPNI